MKDLGPGSDDEAFIPLEPSARALAILAESAAAAAAAQQELRDVLDRLDDENGEP